MKCTFSVLLSLVFTVMLVPSVLAQTQGVSINAGQGISYEYLDTYDLKKIRGMVTTGVRDFLFGSEYSAPSIIDKLKNMPRYSVKLYKVTYESVLPELGDQPVTGTGLVAIPDTKESRFPMISYQHGTIFDRGAVPSQVNKSEMIDETKLMLAVFASQGYVVIAADYFGLGDSTLPNTYFVPRATEQACLDMLWASRAVLKIENKETSHLFLHGWSQGGYNTLRFLKRLETMGETVTAASTAAGPTDLKVWVNRLMNNPQPTDAVWVPSAASNLFLAMDTYLQPGLAEEAIRPEFLAVARQFYNFEISFNDFFTHTPRLLKDYLNPEFMESGKLGTSAFWQLIDTHENYRWTMSTPVRSYYGQVDEAVPAAIVQLPARIAPLLGTSTQALSAGVNSDHRGTYLYSLTKIPAWHTHLMKAEHKSDGDVTMPRQRPDSPVKK